MFPVQMLSSQRRYMRGGSRVFMCLYDLQKAFDSVEYSVLLERLFEVGIMQWEALEVA